jgi:hypothetical protein
MRSRISIILLAALLAAPTVAATWYAKGTSEPDTDLDWNDGWLPKNPDTTPTLATGIGATRPIYFNAFPGAYVGYVAGVATLVNPNVAAPAGVPVRTAHQTYPWTVYAMLGVWKDCNNDGYVGVGEQGVWEYPAQLLTATTGDSICKVGSISKYTSGASSGQVVKNFPFPHNDGKWIREFIPIGWDEGAVSSPGTPGTVDYNPVNINDSGSRVWGDWNKPGAPPGGTCYVRPQPRGTFHSFGGVTDYADCFASGRIESTLAASPAYDSWLTVRPIGWGEQDDGSQAYVWDCGSPVGPNAKASTLDLQLHAPRSAPGTGSGSLAGTANETGSGLTTGCTSHYDPDETNPGAAAAGAPYSTEGDVINTPQARNQPDNELVYSESARPNTPAPAFRAVDPYMSVDPFMLGLTQSVTLVGYAPDGIWAGTSVTAASRNPYFTRNAGNFEPQPVSYSSYYAHVSASAISAYSLVTPKGMSGVYGREACPVIGAGAGTSANFWKCDPANWWKDVNGADVNPELSVPVSGQPKFKYGSFVGDPYELRDIDCYDSGADPLRTDAAGGDLTVYALVTGTECEFH